jgi:ketosteroid isomerase-like protein
MMSSPSTCCLRSTRAARTPWREKTQAWFDSYASAIGYDVDQLEIHASDDLAFCSFVYHVGGTLGSGDTVSMWVRATLGLRRVDGDWRIVHDHESVPWDPQTGQGLIDLSPT